MSRTPLDRKCSAVKRILMLLLVFWCSAIPAGENGRRAILLEVDGAIGPAVMDYLSRGIEKAAARKAELVILRMDTPGGLDTAMRDIIKNIIAASVPVATWVAPGGARAASAGTYIAYASHIAAMAPATNLGAATPVQISPGMPPGAEPPEREKGRPEQQDGEGDAEAENGEDDSGGTGPTTAMERKVINDAVAYIRGLAQMRGRNAEWAEKAVREGVSLSAEDALEQGVIDLIAADEVELLRAIDGREVTVLGATRRLHTQGARVTVIAPDWRSRMLAIITNPNVAYILMLLGIYGLFFELSNPGNILPGVAGAICLLLAFYAFQVLPINYAGFALMLLGIVFMVGEAFVPSFGALGIGGVIAFVVGSLILMETDVEGYQISVPLIVSLALASAAFFLVVIAMVARLRNKPVVSGREEMIGSVGEALDGFAGEGTIRVHGELWTARAAQPISQGQRVCVIGMEGLTLLVEPLSKEG